MSKVTFEAELIQGHKGVTAVEVPFDPEVRWRKKPFRLAGRRHGWPVRGTCAGHPIEGYIGERWGRRFVMIDAALRRAADLSVGDRFSVTLTPSEDPETLARAIEQSKRTTQPGKARPDALPAPAIDVEGPLARVRRICAGWPGVLETTTFGHPTLQAGKKKTFAVLDDHERPGMLCLVVKLPASEQARVLRDPRFTPSKFGARHGWTSMVVDRQTAWKEVPSLLLASYRLVAGKRLVAELEADGALDGD